MDDRDKQPNNIIGHIILCAEKSEDITPRQLKIIKTLAFESFFNNNVVLLVKDSEEKSLLEPLVNIFFEPTLTLYYKTAVAVFLKVGHVSSHTLPMNDQKLNSTTDNSQVVNKIDKDMTFENFFIGESNKVVFAACEFVAEEPGNKFNPLFIYGAPGLGKTHLLNAISNRLLDINSGLNILYTSAEDFLNDYVYYMQIQKPDLFNKKYNSLDVLLIDDIQFFSENMEGAINAFFGVFETLHKKHKQIVVTADVEPDKLKQFHKRMISRFKQSVYYGMDKPEIELKINYIYNFVERNIKTDEEKQAWTHKIVNKIAGSAGINIRELNGFLARVVLYCTLNNEKISENIINKLIKDSNISQNNNIDPNKITDAVAIYFNILPSDIKGSERIPTFVKARHIAMYLSRKITNLTTTQIGAFFNKDHSAIINADKKIKKLINENNDIYFDIEQISEIINNE